MKDPASESEIRSRALNLLARREHSPAELQRKLAAAGFETEVIGTVLAQLAHEGLLSVERFAQARVRQGLSRGDGPRKIASRLQQAGVKSPGPGAMRDDNGEPIDWLAQAQGLCQRRFGDAPPDSAKEWSRRARFLAARGYPEQTVRQVLGGIPRP